MPPTTATVGVRYMIDDVADAIASTPPTSASLSSRTPPQRLPPSAATVCGYCSAARPARADGHARWPRPVPGGWNRLHLQVADLAAEVDRLRAAGCRFRNDIITGPGGSQILLEDPSGNVVELFQPAR